MPTLRDKAKMRLSFGAATWPHQMVRVMLLAPFLLVLSSRWLARGEAGAATARRGGHTPWFAWGFLAMVGLHSTGRLPAALEAEAICVAIRPEKIKLSLRGPAADAGHADAINRLDGTITSWNAAAERLYGYTAAEMIGTRRVMVAPGFERVGVLRRDARRCVLRVRGVRFAAVCGRSPPMRNAIRAVPPPRRG